MSAVIFLFQKIQDPFAALPVGAADGHLDHVIVGEELFDLRIKLRAPVAILFQLQLWHHGRSLSFSVFCVFVFVIVAPGAAPGGSWHIVRRLPHPSEDPALARDMESLPLFRGRWRKAPDEVRQFGVSVSPHNSLRMTSFMAGEVIRFVITISGNSILSERDLITIATLISIFPSIPPTMNSALSAISFAPARSFSTHRS
jgi:hypothetical protein